MRQRRHATSSTLLAEELIYPDSDGKPLLVSRARAADAELRAQRLKARLRELGVDPTRLGE